MIVEDRWRQLIYRGKMMFQKSSTLEAALTKLGVIEVSDTIQTNLFFTKLIIM